MYVSILGEHNYNNNYYYYSTYRRGGVGVSLQYSYMSAVIYW